MKIQYLSDTHGVDPLIYKTDADLVIHGGDAGNGLDSLLEIHEEVKAAGAEFLAVPGNHDLWRHDINDVKDIFNKHKVNYLDHETVFTFQDKIFVGGTLFTNFRQNIVEPWDHDSIKEFFIKFSDFNLIALDGKLVTPSDYVTLFNKTMNLINQYRNNKDAIVVTHFPPKPFCSHPQYPDILPLSGYFTNNINIQGFALWLFGHTHYNIDTVVQGCRLLSNALGHEGEELGIDYNPSLIIEV